MRYFAQICSLLALATLPIAAAPFNQPQEENYTIRIDNRPLVVLHGKIVTLLDVVKDMDKKMREVSPESLLSPVSCIQFYNSHWREALNLLVQNSLIIKEAEEMGIQLSDAQIYEELENQFGPNVIQTLDRLGLTYEQAKRKVYEDIVLNYMQWVRVYQKAFQNTTPEKLQIAYAKYLQENPPAETYAYQIVSVRSEKDPYEMLAAQIAPFLSNTNIEDVEGLVAKLREGPLTDAAIQVSKPYNVNASQMSGEHLSILSNLLNKTCSKPTIQRSRQDGSSIMRIFYLIDHEKQETPSFGEMENYLKNMINQEEAQKLHEEYIAKLKKRYRCDRDDFYHLIPDHYQPFALE